MSFSYLGKAYHGWQKQPNATTVQEVLENALGTLLRNTTPVVGAGRTDTGVHAREMVAHFDVENEIDVDDIIYRLNAFLPDDIAVHTIYPVTEEAHARFDAEERTYQYWIVKKKNPFYTERAHLVLQEIDLAAMNAAAELLLGKQNFQAFSRSNTDVKTFDCDVRMAQWEDRGNLLVFTISADRFLRNMVRAIVGTLLEIGLHKMPVENLKTIINSQDRSQAGPSVPAKGLYLTGIRYPDSIKNPNG